MIAKISQSGKSVVFVGADDVMHIAPRETLVRFLEGDLETFAFHIKRMATEEGFLRDGRFDESDVFFVDSGEEMSFEEACEKLDGKDDVVEALKGDDERVKKRERYSGVDDW